MYVCMCVYGLVWSWQKAAILYYSHSVFYFLHICTCLISLRLVLSFCILSFCIIRINGFLFLSLVSLLDALLLAVIVLFVKDNIKPQVTWFWPGSYLKWQHIVGKTEKVKCQE